MVLAANNPLAATAAVGGLLWWCHRHSYLTRDNWRRLSQAGGAAKPLLKLAQAGMIEHRALSDSLLVVKPPAYPTNDQFAARYLARYGQPLTPGELRDALARRGHIISAAQLKRNMTPTVRSSVPPAICGPSAARCSSRPAPESAGAAGSPEVA
ncbi:hypothetical protein ABZ307_42845 [Streptomyces griseorubiginosus]|uniref:hypothetical protein n=1 Tax=Streptomyces griseorubiginosus TaxID=67304 RepID=UPI0033A55EEE